MVRFPGAWRALAAAGQRVVSPRSRIRRAWIRRQMISAYAAASRRDFELMLVRYAPDVEVEFDPDLEALGLGGTFRGHEAMLKMMESFGEAWEQWELWPELFLDMGDRFLGLGRFRLPATASGLEFEPDFAQLLTIRGGLVVYEQEFLAWDKGLRAAGLGPDAIPVTARRAAGQSASRSG